MSFKQQSKDAVSAMWPMLLILTVLAFAVLALGSAACFASATSGAVAVEAVPSTVRMIVAYPPGGGTDILARQFARALSPALGVNIIVDNRPGASGLIGTDIVNGSAPDGRTLLMGHITPNAINPGLFMDPPLMRNWKLDAIASTGQAPSVLVVLPSAAVSIAKDVPAWLMKQENPRYLSDGLGSLAHLQMQMLLGIGNKVTHVNYRGGGPALQGLLAGDGQVLFSPGPVCVSWVKSKQLKALAVTTAKRSEALADVPTMAESGVVGFEAPLWWGIFAPKGVPKIMIERYSRETNLLKKQPAMTEWGVSQAVSFDQDTPAEFAAFVEKEKARWSPMSATLK